MRAWCDSPDSAYGINTTAEASQLIPHHPLVDDRSWQGRIVTLRPEAAPHLRLDAAGGGTANGTNIIGWSASDYTNQHWLVLTSAQGRTCLVPVHTGEAPLFADVSSNDWNDGDNVHLWSGTGGWNQSFWLHDLGTGYHMIVPELLWRLGQPQPALGLGRAAVPRAGAGRADALGSRRPRRCGCGWGRGG